MNSVAIRRPGGRSERRADDAVPGVRATCVAGFALLALAAAGTVGAAPSTQFTISGGVSAPATCDVAFLAARTPIAQTVGYLAGRTPQTHTYTGASLWGLLDGAGIVVGPAKNDLLRHVVVATASDGYKVVYALGELSPNFGNRAGLVAYAETVNGVSVPLAADGFARLTAPGDVEGGRYVSNLVGLDVRGSGSTQVGTGGGRSASFSVSGAVVRPMSFDLGALQRLTPLTAIVGGVRYTGVGFWDLLNATTGLALDPSVKNDLLGRYVVATGSDGDQAAFSLGELAPDFGNQPDLIAFAADGAALGASGFARIVVPGDAKAGRWVANLVSLEVLSAVSAVPEPQPREILIGGLGVIARRVALRAAPMPAPAAVDATPSR